MCSGNEEPKGVKICSSEKGASIHDRKEAEAEGGGCSWWLRQLDKEMEDRR